MITKARDYHIDWIRAICSLTVILAHVDAPVVLNQIRTFDVVALVLISGFSFAYAKKSGYGAYIKKRIKKLMLPTYLVITVIFALSWLACKLLNIQQLYSISQIVRSFFLLNNGSMGYVWIVRVYLCIALLTPVITKLMQIIKNDRDFFGFIILCMVFGYVLSHLAVEISNELVKDIFTDYIYSTYVYGVVVFLGVWTCNSRTRMRNVFCGAVSLFVIIQIMMLMSGKGFVPGQYKFPPKMYYCVYGISATYIMYWLLPNKKNNVIEWISKHSFDIYLFHIVVLRAYGLMAKLPMMKFMDDLWLMKYVAVTAGAILLSAIWDMLINKRRGVQNESKKEITT